MSAPDGVARPILLELRGAERTDKTWIAMRGKIEGPSKAVRSRSAIFLRRSQSGTVTRSILYGRGSGRRCLSYTNRRCWYCAIRTQLGVGCAGLQHIKIAGYSCAFFG